MSDPVATVLLVPSRGSENDGSGYRLSPESAARVDAAVGHVLANREVFAGAAAKGRPGRIVFSGGWAEAAAGQAAPPPGSREADLMLRRAAGAAVDGTPLGDRVELIAESESRSTLENLLLTRGEGLLDGHEFTPGTPLGLVCHRRHLPRVRFLAKKVLGLPDRCLQPILAPGSDARSNPTPETLLFLTARLLFLGTSDEATVLRRERRLVHLLGRAPRS
ncbi:hypothetical protein GCM10010399_74780 [Dactylosporangium fulvum]|uniref:YdcF family protein n=1 Tax=Dactylosporangium fulvum TaxID=53359 RepID=A0ABY5VN68_9ACTN|nr:YdcF family protein [Dactylosporangium fulvum]UWP79103.1 YdcF family protein [Dactylosporangium fulvum]